MLRQVGATTAHLAGLDAAGMSDSERIDLLRALEELKCAAEAAQAEVTAGLDETAPSDHGLTAQVALARRESPHRGRQHLSLARVLRELPHTRAAFRAGRIPEWRATLIARETACLTREDRATVDRAIAGDPEALEGYSDRVLLGELRKLAARLDPASVAERRRRAEAERRVTVRPAPDTMAYLTVLLPVAQAVAAYAALAAEADSAIAAGDRRGRGQVMADAFVSRVTGAPTVGGRPVVPVALGLVMTDQALFAGAHDTAHLAGHGPVPAELARELLADSLDAGSRVWLRRLYTHPATGELVAMDSRQRLFRGQLRAFLDLRDQFCRNPWCNAPIRHRDHVTGIAAGGATSADEGQGLCQACNHAKQATGWRARPRPSPGHLVETTTPTGHIYRSGAPPLLGLRVGAYQQVDEGRWVLVA
ncbi:HNH endonuclease [Nocardioides pyridinolyticus]